MNDAVSIVLTTVFSSLEHFTSIPLQLEEHSIEVHNSRRLTLTLTFDLIFVGGRGMTIPVPSLAILVSAVLVLLCGHTDRETDRQNYRGGSTLYSRDYQTNLSTNTAQ